MKPFILAKKGETIQEFDEKGNRMPVTFLHTDLCYLLRIKEKPKDGYCAAVLACGKNKKIPKPTSGSLKKSKIKDPLKFTREFVIKNQEDIIANNGKKGLKISENEIFVGDQMIASSLFTAGAFVNATGISKGKGFAGVVKRHGFAGGPRTHGQSDRERSPGSIGQSTTPGRVYKGKRMAGRMGMDKITVRNLQITATDQKYIKVKGLVPGAKGGLLKILS